MVKPITRLHVNSESSAWQQCVLWGTGSCHARGWRHYQSTVLYCTALYCTVLYCTVRGEVKLCVGPLKESDQRLMTKWTLNELNLGPLNTLDEPNLVPRKSQNRAIPVLLRLLLLPLTLVLLLLLPMSKSGQVCQTQQIQDWSPCSGLGEPLFLEILPFKKIGDKKNTLCKG